MWPDERSEVHSVAYASGGWRRNVGVTTSGFGAFVFGDVGANGFELFVSGSELRVWVDKR